MNKTTEALKMAIEALSQDEGWFEPEAAIKACKEALAQPAQEPVAMYENGNVNWINTPKDNSLLYTHPAPSWQGLSDDEISKTYNDLYEIYESDNVGIGDFMLIARAIEAAHGIGVKDE